MVALKCNVLCLCVLLFKRVGHPVDVRFVPVKPRVVFVFATFGDEPFAYAPVELSDGKVQHLGRLFLVVSFGFAGIDVFVRAVHRLVAYATSEKPVAEVQETHEVVDECSQSVFLCVHNIIL